MPEAEPFSIDHDEPDDELIDDLNDDVDDLAKDDPEIEALRAEIKESTKQIADLNAKIDKLLDVATVKSQLTDKPLQPPDVDTSDPTPSPDLDKKKEALDEAKKKMGEDAEEKGKAGEGSLKWTIAKYLGGIVGIPAIGAGLFFLIKYFTDRGQNPSQPGSAFTLTGVDQKTKDTLDALYDNWKAKPDADFWNALADYIDKNAGVLSLGDQLVFMNLTVSLAGLSGGFLWDTAQDENDLADKLVAAYNENKSTPDMIRAAAKLTYNSQPIPRVVTAQLLQLAYAWIGVNPTTTMVALVHPADTPPAFRPVIRLVSVTPGVDAAGYAERLVRAFVPPLADEHVAALVPHINAAPMPVADRAAKLAAMPPDAVVKMRAYSIHVDELARRAFASAPDTLVASTVSVTDEGGPFPAGTVVWTRQGSEATAQFVFPELVADLSAGTYERRRLVPRAMPSPESRTVRHTAGLTPMAAMASSQPTLKTVFEGAVTVASSVSWALPPPWNVAATAGLSILELILKSTDDPKGTSPSPLDTMKQAIEDYLKAMNVTNELDTVRAFSDNLLLKTADFTYAPAEMPVSGDPDFEMWFDSDSEGINVVDLISNSLVSKLEQVKGYDDANFDTILAGTTTALTAWTVGMKVWMQYTACKLAAQLAAGDATAYALGTASWQKVFREIQRRLLGLADPSDPNTPQVQGLVSRVDTALNTLQTNRLGQVGPAQRASYTYWEAGAVDPSTGAPIPRQVTANGWNFVDAGAGDDVKTHFHVDTTEEIDASNSKNVEHQQDAIDERTTYITNLTKTINDRTGDAVLALKGLNDKITEIAGLMPPPPPKDKLTVALMTSGTATPAGPWTDGATVTYQIAFANDDAIGDPGPPSAPVTIGGFAGATLTNTPQDGHANFIHIVRTITPAGDKPIVRKLLPVAMGTTTVTDNMFK